MTQQSSTTAASEARVAAGHPVSTSGEERGQSQELMGGRLREARLKLGFGVRELARQLDVSASLISQIELGRVVPSVSTLYTLTNALGVSMDSLFLEPHVRLRPDLGNLVELARTRDARIDAADAEAPTEPDAREHSIIQRHGGRRTIELEQGVRWELLTPVPESGAEFLEVHYPAGGGSSPTGHAVRHNGRDYCLILEGTLAVQIGFEQYVLDEGDSLAFDATTPHRFWNAGTTLVRAVWFVLDRCPPGS
ncbi:MAG TPA: cupin domain-containing protein [Acidimicrobiales bacterium]|nr:cupin domain-containing protein [Acidimicrobiales bacterium]